MSKIPSREETLFADAIALPPAERGAFLAQACGANIDLLAHLVALVAAHEGPDSLMALPVLERPALLPDLSAIGLATVEEKPGVTIGRYKLLQQIGEGGCGIVWMAEQEEPVRRRVALKVIKLGMDTKTVVARFEAERQALAMMDHPNIAKVLDGGATESGRPYFVMELVRGIPITRFCDDNKLPTKERLQLFIQVCHAIQHAHQKGIIHRDIKPSNILVTLHDETAVPMVIDFGIAKATQGRLTDQTLFTAFEQFIGTPVYMSPEQAEYNALDVDTRSDIYSLGVLLYELLTGRPPFDPKTLTAAGLDQVRKIIREAEPPRPSMRVRTLTHEERTTVAKTRAIAPAQLSTLLRGDLDWIVMKALEKNRVRRYQTANAFAMDVQRYMAHEPVVARPPSAAYWFRKLFLRHKVGFAAGGLVAASLIGGLIVSTALYFREKRAYHRAFAAETATRQSEHAAATARLQAETLLSFIFTDLGAQLEEFGQLPILQQVSERVVAYYEGLPSSLQTRETRASHAFAIGTVGAVLGSRGEGTAGQEQLARAVEIFRELESTGPFTPFMHVASGVTAWAQAFALRRDRRFAQAVAMCERGENSVVAVLDNPEWGEWAQRVLTDLLHLKAYVLTRARRWSEAVPEFQRAIASAEAADRRAAAPRRPGFSAACIKADAGEAFFHAGQRAEARAMIAQARVSLREFVDREPFLVTAKVALGLAGRNAAAQASSEWNFEEMRVAVEEQETQLAQALKLDEKNLSNQNTLAGSHWTGKFHYSWMMRDFKSAETAVRNGIQLLGGESATPSMRNNLITARNRWVQILAATGRAEETERQLAITKELYARFKDDLGFENIDNEVNLAEARNAEFHQLNWLGLRRLAERQLEMLTRSEANPVDASREQRRGAIGALIRAEFEMGDYSAARRRLDSAGGFTVRLPRNADLNDRFRAIGNHLLRIHVLARSGEREKARDAIVEIWPEVDAVLAAGPDYVFNQAQTARALSIRAEIDGDVAAKRGWLDRAADYLRPAAAAGKLTRYEREVLLAGIEKQLAALPPNQT